MRHSIKFKRQNLEVKTIKYVQGFESSGVKNCYFIKFGLLIDFKIIIEMRTSFVKVRFPDSLQMMPGALSQGIRARCVSFWQPGKKLKTEFIPKIDLQIFVALKTMKPMFITQHVIWTFVFFIFLSQYFIRITFEKLKICMIWIK